MIQIEIDEGSGFCFGVTTAIKKAEEELAQGRPLYCLGDIVHNGMECDRLREMGLITINHEEMRTCPVVLQLQKKIKQQYETSPKLPAGEESAASSSRGGSIVIFGKKGHAEVLGLVGQTQSSAIVIESFEEVTKLDFTRDIYLYSQTTKSLDEFHRIIDYIQSHMAPNATFKSFDTICRSVANRMPNISQFATKHDLILFVCGRKSSNGKVLYNECLRVNPNTHLVEDPQEIQKEWLEGIQTVGICGATSTPRWLMEQCSEAIQQMQ